jgi:Xaa-Pro aminopeptidase
VIYPEAHESAHREILFVRQPNPHLEMWEGHKLTKEEAMKLSGIENIQWIQDFPALFHRLMCECGHVYLNTNEHKRAHAVVETRDARFIREVQQRYPLHDFQRLAPVMHRLRSVKSEAELNLMRRACAITEAGFRRVCRFVKAGVNEMEIEAEFSHEFLRRGGHFAYTPIIASGRNACVLHYVQNDQPCRKGDLVLLDVAASWAGYNSDLTRTIPVSGRFSRRQKQVYDAVLRVMRASAAAATPGKLPRDWQKESEAIMGEELVGLGLLKRAQIKKTTDAGTPAVKKYFTHGIGHPIGLDVHDVALTVEPIQAGWVLTVEPGIYLPDEGFAVRLENNVLVCEGANLDLMETIPVEVDEIEALMAKRQAK